MNRTCLIFITLMSSSDHFSLWIKYFTFLALAVGFDGKYNSSSKSR